MRLCNIPCRFVGVLVAACYQHAARCFCEATRYFQGQSFDPMAICHANRSGATPISPLAKPFFGSSQHFLFIPNAVLEQADKQHRELIGMGVMFRYNLCENAFEQG